MKTSDILLTEDDHQDDQKQIENEEQQDERIGTETSRRSLKHRLILIDQRICNTDDCGASPRNDQSKLVGYPPAVSPFANHPMMNVPMSRHCLFHCPHWPFQIRSPNKHGCNSCRRGSSCLSKRGASSRWINHRDWVFLGWIHTNISPELCPIVSIRIIGWWWFLHKIQSSSSSDVERWESNVRLV